MNFILWKEIGGPAVSNEQLVVIIFTRIFCICLILSLRKKVISCCLEVYVELSKSNKITREISHSPNCLFFGNALSRPIICYFLSNITVCTSLTGVGEWYCEQLNGGIEETDEAALLRCCGRRYVDVLCALCMSILGWRECY